MADFAHTADALANREAKAKLLYWQLVLAGHLEVPTDPKVRLYLRKGAGLDRAPSEETWALAGELLAAWPPVVMRAAWDQPTGPCGCHVDPDTRMLFEVLPRDRETGRFQGWPCPHNSPAHLGCRPPDRFPAVSQNDRAEVAAAVVTMSAAQRRKAAAQLAAAASPPPGESPAPTTARDKPWVPTWDDILAGVRAGADAPPAGEQPADPTAERDGLQALGLDVEVDESLPPDVVEFRHPDGTVAGRITGRPDPAPAPAADPDDWWA